MRKWKLALLLLLTAALIIAGAKLPGITSAVTDSAALGKVSYGILESVQLELRERNSLTTMEKLILSRSGDSIEVTEKDTRMTMEQALEAADEALAPYIDAELITWVGERTTECHPRLMFEASFGLHGYFWNIFITYGGDSSRNLNLLLDDATGKIITIYYATEETLFGETEMSGSLETFVQVYREGLDLPEPSYRKDSTLGRNREVSYWWEEGDYERCVVFCVYDTGFYNYLL